MSNMNRVFGGGNLGAPGGAEHAVDEARKATLFAPPGWRLGRATALVGISLGVGDAFIIAAVLEEIHAVL